MYILMVFLRVNNLIAMMSFSHLLYMLKNVLCVI